MATSLRELIMVEIKSRLEAIQTSAGYSQTVREVRRIKARLPENPVVPAIYVYEGTEEKDDMKSIGKLECDLLVPIVYLAEDYTNQTTTANAMLADVTQAMGTTYSFNDANGKETIAVLTEGDNQVVVDPSNANLIIAGIDFHVRYRHTLGDQTIQ